MTVRATTTAAGNVIAGWLGIGIPSIPRQRNRSRAGYRKTNRRSLPPLIRELEAKGCRPRPAGPGVWFALCPECRSSIAEIRMNEDGTPIIACADAHERGLAA